MHQTQRFGLKRRSVLSWGRMLSTLCISSGILGAVLSTQAQTQGFQINRYEPTTAGEWSFMVDHPWFAETRPFAVGLTFNYAHNPFQLGLLKDGKFEPTASIIEHQLIGHVDLAFSIPVKFLRRFTFGFSLPVILYEQSNSISDGIGGTVDTGVQPIDTIAAGDLRFSILGRIYGNSYTDPFSINASVALWIPINKYAKIFPQQVGEQEWRVMPKLIMGGMIGRKDSPHKAMWSFTGGFYYRPDAQLGSLPNPDIPNRSGMEVQIGAALGYANLDHNLSLVPEFLFSTLVTNRTGLETGNYGLEMLLGLNYNIGRQVQLGVAGGVGLLRQPGTPDGRALLRLAYAPLKKPVAPISDRDGDGILDKDDVCPDTHKGPNPDPDRLGCPLSDRDGDGVWDKDDQCPDVPKGPNPDPDRLGCPLGDRDSDGILDKDDKCPDVPKGPNPDPRPDRLGCPRSDRDGDGVWDDEDICPDVHKGPNPDPNRLGCPLPEVADRDKDGVPDKDDICPDVHMGPDPDPKRLGCPKAKAAITVDRGRIDIYDNVYFDTNKATIRFGGPRARRGESNEDSRPVLEAVRDVLSQNSDLKFAVVASADCRGSVEYNLTLTQNRAQSVVTYLSTAYQSKAAIVSERLVAIGCGKIDQGECNANARLQKNRRVEFIAIPEGIEATRDLMCAKRKDPDLKTP